MSASRTCWKMAWMIAGRQKQVDLAHELVQVGGVLGRVVRAGQALKERHRVGEDEDHLFAQLSRVGVEQRQDGHGLAHQRGQSLGLALARFVQLGGHLARREQAVRR
jgi:hypothetical protein